MRSALHPLKAMYLNGHIRRAVYALLLALALGTTAVLFYLQRPPPAPSTTLTLIDGSQVSLAALRGRPVLVNFWSTTCRICLHEMPRLATLYAELEPAGLEIIAIAMPYDPPVRVAAYAKQRRLPYLVALDIDGKALRAFGGVRGTPAWFLIAPDGTIAMRQYGELDTNGLRNRIERLLKYQVPPPLGAQCGPIRQTGAHTRCPIAAA